MSARSRALIPLSAEQQAAMQAVAVTEQRRRQGRTLSAWPYATAFFRCLNGRRRNFMATVSCGWLPWIN